MKKNKSEIIVEFGFIEEPSSKIDFFSEAFESWISDPERSSEGDYDIMISSCGLRFKEGGTSWESSFNIFSNSLSNLDWQVGKLVEFIKEKFTEDWETIDISSWSLHNSQFHKNREEEEVNPDG